MTASIAAALSIFVVRKSLLEIMCHSSVKTSAFAFEDIYEPHDLIITPRREGGLLSKISVAGA